jgi:hypothetical protein
MSKKYAFLLAGLVIPSDSSSVRSNKHKILPVGGSEDLGDTAKIAVKQKPSRGTSSTIENSGGQDHGLPESTVTIGQYLASAYPTSPSLASALENRPAVLFDETSIRSTLVRLSLGETQVVEWNRFDHIVEEFMLSHPGESRAHIVELATIRATEPILKKWKNTSELLNEHIHQVNSISDAWIPTLGDGNDLVSRSRHSRINGGVGYPMSDDSVLFSVTDDPHWLYVKYTNSCSKLLYADVCESSKKQPKQSTGSLISKLVSFCSLKKPAAVHVHVDPLSDPLRDEYLIIKTLERLGLRLTPPVYELSAAMIPTRNIWTDRDPRMVSPSVASISKRDMNICHDMKSAVRALAFGPMGVRSSARMHELYAGDVAAWGKRKGKVQMRKPTMVMALTTGMKTIQALVEIHAYGFVHGSISADNVLIQNHQVQLVNFEKGKFFPAEIGTSQFDPAFVQGNPSIINYLSYSPWALQGQRVGRRDDIYSAIEMTAALLLPNGAFAEYVNAKYKREMDNFEHGIIWMDDMIEMKTTHNFFTDNRYDETNKIVSFKTICGMYSLDMRALCHDAMEELSRALQLIRLIGNSDERPPYEEVLKFFESALEILQ